MSEDLLFQNQKGSKDSANKRKGVSTKQSNFIAKSFLSAQRSLYFLLVDNITKLIYLLRPKVKASRPRKAAQLFSLSENPVNFLHSAQRDEDLRDEVNPELRDLIKQVD